MLLKRRIKYLSSILLGITLISTNAFASEFPTVKADSSKLFFYDEEVKLDSPLIKVKKNGQSKSEYYVSLNEIMNFMNFDVQVNEKKNELHIVSKGTSSNNDESTPPSDFSLNKEDLAALELMNKTGNWKYIEPYLPKMTHAGIDAVVASYNSKHPDPKEHKKASRYYHK